MCVQPSELRRSDSAFRRAADVRNFRLADALTDYCRGIVPADLVLLCGVLGSVTDQNVATTIADCIRR
jgi:hypothetical protein